MKIEISTSSPPEKSTNPPDPGVHSTPTNDQAVPIMDSCSGHGHMVHPIVNLQYTVFVGALLVLFLSSCTVDMLIVDGVVFDVERHEPIENAELLIGGLTTFTDQEGMFVIRDLEIDTDYVLQIEQADYVSVVRRLRFSTADSLSINFPMIARNKPRRFNASDSLSMTSEDSVEVTMRPNSLRTMAGDPYRGVVDLSVTFINPKEPNVIVAAPGALVSDDSLTLETFGMLEIYAATPEGDRLELASERPITISLPNISRLSNDVGLYYLDITSGFWFRDSILRLDKQSNKLLGEVTSISTALNADEPCATNSVCVTIRVVDNNGNPEVRAVAAKGLSYDGFDGFYVTDNAGFANFNVCPNEVFQVYDDIIPCCDGSAIPGTPEHDFCCVNGGQVKGPIIDLSTVVLDPPPNCTLLGDVTFPS